MQNDKQPSSAVISVDWSKLAHGLTFLIPCRNTVKVGEILASYIRVLEQHGASRRRMHLIGYSLGGKVVSAAGSLIQSPKISRITGNIASSILYCLPIRNQICQLWLTVHVQNEIMKI